MNTAAELNPLEADPPADLLRTALTQVEQRWAFSLQGFDSVLEPPYQRFRAQQMLPLQRLSVIIAVVLYLAFVISDALTFRSYQHMGVYGPILLGGIPACLLYYASTHIKRLQPYGFGVAALACMTNAAILSISSVSCARQGIPLPAEAMVIQLFYSLLLTGLPVRLALTVSAASIVLFTLLHVMAGLDPEFVMYRILMLTSSASIGVLICGLLEREQRLGWLRSQLLEQLTERDALSGLYNHRDGYERGRRLLRQCQRDNKRLGVIAADIDHFKKINDTYGHLAGDECLRAVARAVEQAARRPMDVPARTGGEEFLVLLYDVTPEGLRTCAEKLRRQVEEQVRVGGRPVTLSAGYSLSGPDDTQVSLETLITRADQGLYRAKNAGRNQVSD